MFQQVRDGCVLLVEGNVQGGAFVANRVYICAVQQEFFCGRVLSIKHRFRERRVAQLFPRVHVGPFVEQVTKCIDSAFRSRQRKRHASTAARVHVRSGKVKQTHAAKVSVHRRLRKVALTLLFDAWQSVHKRQREH